MTTNRTKDRRFQYHLTWHAKAKLWVCKVGGAVFAYGPRLQPLVTLCAWCLDAAHKTLRQRSELFIHRKDHTIGKGSSSRRTYGGDPRRTKG